MNHRHPALAFALMALGSAAQAAVIPETRVLMLSGEGKDDAIPWEFRCSAGRNSGQAWTTIPVPSSWECQGFGTFGYQKDPTKEEGFYRRSFQVPADWKGQHIRLVFDGVQTDTTVRINGQSAGQTHIGGFYRFTYDVTALVKPGQENRIEVDVAKRSRDESVNLAERTGDYWNFGGIFRPVSLECDPPQHVERVAIDARADGHFQIDVVGGGSGNADTVEVVVTTRDGTPVGAPLRAPWSASGTTRLTGTFDGISPWNAEAPHLYQADVRLLQGGQALHHRVQRFGFRTMELRTGDGIYVNGTRVILKGACRHSFWPESGRTTSPALSRTDITLMKEMNANAVRMSHYPPDQHFLDLCDELGLYVLDELAGWGGGKAHQCYATPIGKTLVQEMVVRDVNHPSILFWDNGNEGGWNTDLDDEFARWDPQQRHIIHPYESFRGLNTKHYPGYSQLRSLLAESNVVMPTEFLHGLYDGGAGAGMEDYWPLLTGPHGGGGFVWAWLDESVKRPDLNGILDGNDNKAPDGIVGPYREREGSYFTLRRLWSPVQIPLTTLPAGESIKLPVENRYAFTNLSTCRFSWELRRLATAASGKAGSTVIASGELKAPEVAPGASGHLTLGLPATAATADVLALTARNAGGQELWTWTWSLPQKPEPVTTAPRTPVADAVRTADGLVLTSGDLAVTIDPATGYLKQVRRGTATFPLTNGPRPTTGPATLTDLRHRAENGSAVVEATYRGDLIRTQWRLDGAGWLHLDYTYRHDAPASHLGVGFDLPQSSVNHLRWAGQGPYRVYQNRLLGGTLDVWSVDRNDTITGSVGWRYPEVGGYYADVRWMTVTTTAGPITVRPGERGRFVQVLPLPTGKFPANAVAEYPDTGLSLLDAIAPIGDKFRPPKDLGPKSQPTVRTGEIHGSADFWFGPDPQ